ncbi:MAG: cysteine synthase family protein [Anaerolineae bacterium]|nr:MAG: cysteine synthase [Chloroflexi bacterium OLB13]MBW7880326.1 cysteine synthase family protein [Anaerolineae bacterium]MDL1917665.1 cysteine synthase family protein [Anaerolineae bacterium CFX4]MEB2367557.1 cysteine synthase family protein [Chloroflexota bacterium]OQY84489.1 MAG: cysteine synthase [Anaerolineae bacterium UTCFX5]
MVALASHPTALPAALRAAQPLESQIGNTPLLGFTRITAHLPDTVHVYAKAEWTNPGGSVKDRAALAIVRDAINRDLLTGGKILLDSTSGNTGIAYAMLGAAKRFAVKLYLPANASPERIAILRAYGAELALTDPLEGSDGAIRAARAELAAHPDRYYYADQYNNPANWQAHYHTTAPEIWRQTHGTVTHFVAGVGTSGTLMGVGRGLKAFNPAITVISMQPNDPFHGVEGWKHMATAIVPGIYDDRFADRDIAISTEESCEMARRLAREEGYLVGISSAAAMVGALRIAGELAGRGEPGVVVTLFPDNAYKYLSEGFWSRP